MTNYLQRAIIYPEAARRNGIEGRVLVVFAVNEQGDIEDVEVQAGANPLLDSEAVRVVQSMKNWTPGKMHNRVGKVFMSVPITFRLN